MRSRTIATVLAAAAFAACRDRPSPSPSRVTPSPRASAVGTSAAPTPSATGRADSAGPTSTVRASGAPTAPPQRDAQSASLLAALRRRMITPRGGVLSHAVGGGVLSHAGEGRQEDPSVAGAGHERTSESTGLLMAEAVAVRDAELFALAHGYYVNVLRAPNGLAVWKADAQDRPVRSEDGSYSSAPIDELRIARALLVASSWLGDGSLRREAVELAGALRSAVRDGLLTEDVSWDPADPSDRWAGDHALSAYQDVAGLRALAAVDGWWDPVVTRGVKTAAGAVRDGAAPWTKLTPPASYSCESQTCETTPGLWVALHLPGGTDRAAAQRALLFYLSKLDARGKLDDGWTASGSPSGDEELAAYALLARLALRLGDADRARSVMQRFVQPHRIVGGDLAGLYSLDDGDAPGFDNLEVLLTLDELGGSIAPGE